tara:strand:- start:451 stop:732 length:282 start_codon:yes stop_codon:yes gene_type:complete
MNPTPTLLSAKPSSAEFEEDTVSEDKKLVDRVRKCAAYFAADKCDDITKISHNTLWEDVIQKAVNVCQKDKDPDTLGDLMLRNKAWWGKKCPN